MKMNTVHRGKRKLIKTGIPRAGEAALKQMMTACRYPIINLRKNSRLLLIAHYT